MISRISTKFNSLYLDFLCHCHCHDETDVHLHFSTLRHLLIISLRFLQPIIPEHFLGTIFECR